jgi:HAD superfamily hydrolase (TIGR01490 family)
MSIAIFDIDNTLVRGSTAFPAVRALARAGLIESRGLYGAVYEQMRFRVTATEPDLAKLRSRALAAIRDVSVLKIDEVLDSVADRLVAKAVFPGSLKLIRSHLEMGDEVWLATAGPARLANMIAQRLGAHGAIGSEVEVENGRCTGALAGPFLHGEEKAAAVATLAEARGWDPAAIHAYSDSFRDLPMLLLASVPNVVNPDSKLRRFAESRNWPIHDTSNRNRNKKLTRLTAASLAAVAASGAIFTRRER